MEISLSKYDTTYTLIQNEGNSKLGDEYKKIVESYNSRVIEIPAGIDMDKFLLKKYNESYQDVIMDYIVGVSIDRNGSILAWFNNEAIHSLPLTISLINQAILKSSLGQNYETKVTNSPFYFEEKVTNGEALQIIGDILSDATFAFFLFVVFSNWMSVFISFYIKERVSRTKLLQTISGVNKLIFWMVSYMFDAILMILISLVIIGTISIFQAQHYKTAEELFRLFLLFSMYSLSSLPMTYLFSHLFTQASTGESMNALLGITSGVVLYGVYVTLSSVLAGSEAWSQFFNVLYWFFMISPHFTLCDALKRIVWLNFQHQPFHGILEEADLKELQKKIGDYWSFKDGISTNLLAFLIVGIVYLTILLCKEHHLFHRIFYFAKPNPGLPELNPEMDSDVEEETDRVIDMSPEQLAEQNLVMKNLTKYYKNFLAVKRLCVAVGDSECFGLLGANGAGKTSVFKMLTGDEIISNGDGFIQNCSIKSQINEVHKKIGYCPQFDALLEDLTGRETMEIFCLLRGIPRSQVKTISNKLANKLDFAEHLDKQIKAYSGGNKRKLSTALALIGDPQVIFLDEPTTGMDPGAKRKLWDVIIKIRSHGKSVILTSHSMEECEALCTRLAIMVGGEFKCLGSTQHLKNKFSKGFILSIKAGKSETMERCDHIIEIKEFVNRTFPGAVLK
jgi:ATP-binding cassette subfamily A (ABC1) protein 3